MTKFNSAIRPIATFSTIAVHIFENESFELKFWPPDQNYYELEIKGRGFNKAVQTDDNLYFLLVLNDYVLW